MDSIQNMEKLGLLGLTLAVTTTQKETLIGEVFYYSSESKILILKEKIHDSNKYHFRYINTDYLTEYKIISVKNLNEINFDMPELDFEAVLQKEDERLHEMGVYGDVGYADDEVEEYRKYVLERLGKNHKVEEDGDHLVIHSLKLTIYPPYDPDCVEGENPDSVKSIQKSLRKIGKEFDEKQKSGF